MADAITIKALQDASLDAKSLEEVVNGNDTKQVTTRLGETYPSVKKAIKTLFENGGLPATPFTTKALMTASALANNKYAMVTDDTVNNGLYVKTAGAWVKSKYDTASASDIIKLYDFINGRSAKIDSYVSVLRRPLDIGIMSPSPSHVFGDDLIFYYDRHSPTFNSSGAVSSSSVASILGLGVYHKISVYNKARKDSNSQPIYTAEATSIGNDFNKLTYLERGDLEGNACLEINANAIKDLKDADNFSVWIAKNSFSAYATAGDRLLLTDEFSWDLARNTLGGVDTFQWNIRTFDEQAQAMRVVARWQLPASEVVGELGAEQLLWSDTGIKITTFELTYSKSTGRLSLYLNGKNIDHAQVFGDRDGYSFDGTELTSINSIRTPIAMAITKNSNGSVGDYYWQYMTRPSTYQRAEYRGDSHLPYDIGRTRYNVDTNPSPIVFAGGYNIESADYLKQDYTLGSTIKKSPSLVVPSNPNVAPWSQPHDPTKLDASVIRLSALPHPDDPSNTNKILLMAGNLFYPQGSNKYTHTNMLAYESNDGGKSFIPIELAYSPSTLPTSTTTTINNSVTHNLYGRYLYLGDVFPDGYTPDGMSEAFKYIFLCEVNRTMYGCGDVLDFRTYEPIKINRHGYVVHASSGVVNNQDMLSADMHLPGNDHMTRNEDKIIKYDKTSGRFFRILKTTKPTIDHEPITTSESDFARHMVISWSEVNDITRWSPYEMFVPARTGYYQTYDLDVIQVRDDYWVALVSTYNEYLSSPDPSEPYADEHLRMHIDMYVSRDQFRTPPVLMRESFISNDEQSWAYGTLWAYGHPFNKNRLYLCGGVGLHGAIIEGQMQRDNILKVAYIDYDFDVNALPDVKVLNGTVRSRLMDGAGIDNLRVITPDGFIQVRILNSQGVVVAGYDFNDFVLKRVDQICSWNGVQRLPSELIYIEVRGVNAEFGGIYPMTKEHIKW